MSFEGSNYVLVARDFCALVETDTDTDFHKNTKPAFRAGSFLFI